jgi:hypothetical protein
MKINDPDPELLQSKEVREDPGLFPFEKEVRLWGSKTENRMTISTEVPPAIRWIIAHPLCEVDWVRVIDGYIVAAHATIPRSLVSVKSEPRKSNHWNRVFSKPEVSDD